MREAAIAPPRLASRGRRGKTSEATKNRRRATAILGAWLFLRRRPGQALAAASCVVLASSIIGNAIFFQSGRHPSPLFGSTAPTHPVSDSPVATIPLPVPAPRVVAALPPSPPDVPERITEDSSVVSVPKVVAAGPSPIRPMSPKKVTTHKDDTIGQWLRKPAEADPRVATAQRSLEKLGFAVKADGRMGTSTRQALEKFQHDHHLGSGDVMSPKLLRELATAAGLPPG